MGQIFSSTIEAFKIISSWDRELYGIIGLTLMVTLLSTGISSLAAIPAGILIGSSRFTGKRLIVRIIHTFMGLPPVIAGLVVYLFLSRKGPLGSLELLFTPAAMILAQILIIFPVVAGLSISAVQHKVKPVLETCHGLRIGKWKTLSLLFHECRYPLVSALLAGYGRAVSEVGAVMLVGGNIQYHTRVMTTSIVLETGKGNYDRALALGILLLAISFTVNWIVQNFQEGQA